MLKGILGIGCYELGGCVATPGGLCISNKNKLIGGLYI